MSEKILCLDIESTGLETPGGPPVHAVQIVLQWVHRERDPSTQDTTYEWIVRPPVPIPDDVAAIHGFTNEMVSGSPPFGVVAAEIAAFVNIADGILGYNPDFDIAVLQREFELANCPVKWPRAVICCKRLWDINDPRPKRTLVNAYKAFVHGRGFADAHNAKADVAATVAVFKTMQHQWKLGDKPFIDLDPERKTWVGPSDHFVWTDDYRDSMRCNFGKFKGKWAREIDRGYLSYIMGNDFPPHVKKLAEKLKLLSYPDAVRWARENL